MCSYRLVSIYDYSEREFGAYQAEAYLSGLECTFGLLADFPGIGQAFDELTAGYRRFRFQAHYVFYTSDADGIVIDPCDFPRRARYPAGAVFLRFARCHSTAPPPPQPSRPG